MSQATFDPPIDLSERPLPPLRPGERLDQATFHARYAAMPSHIRAELVGGMVSMPSPVGPDHGGPHSKLIFWVVAYEASTPGVKAYDNTSAILGPNGEPQPDCSLIVAPEKGGQMKWSSRHKGFLEGAPEFVCEVAVSSESFDLRDKLRDYEAAGVREYVVVAVREQRVYWFVRSSSGFEELAADADGVYRSEVFPGLWLDGAAALAADPGRLLDALQQGLATPEHAAFVAALAKR